MEFVNRIVALNIPALRASISRPRPAPDSRS
jgi:hypothetical protein